MIQLHHLLMQQMGMRAHTGSFVPQKLHTRLGAFFFLNMVTAEPPAHS